MALNETETGFQDAILELAQLQGWVSYHTYDSRRSVEGFPDLVMVRGSRLIFAELKKPKAKLTKEQDTWMFLLGRTRAETYVWRPGNWDDIVEVLKR